MSLLIPGKTFLAGEYSVLLEGAAIGLATKPCFEVIPAVVELEKIQEIHPESPAGQYLAQLPLELRKKITFKDPYLKVGIQGGFGRSTAEFLAVLSAVDQRKPFADIRNLFLELHSKKQVKPSGIDLAFQYYGHVCVATPQSNQYETTGWTFPDLGFFIVATGLKIKSHEHLALLDLKKLGHLPSESDQVIEAFKSNDESNFLASLKNWSDVLNAAGLTHSLSVEIKNKLESHADILLVKPCGALGADVLIIFFNEHKKVMVRKTIEQIGLQIVAGTHDLSDGMRTYVE